MQGYGSRRRPRRRVQIAWSAGIALVAGVAVACMSSCSIVSDLATPDESRTIVIPETDALTTESSVASTSTDADSDTDADSGAWDNYSFGHIVSVAPRADAQRFRRGAKTQKDPLTRTSGYHFSTPDRVVQCSTGSGGTGTLACVSPRVEGAPSAPRGTPTSCKWNEQLATLGPGAPAAGACSNLYPVLTRSAILPFGQTLAVGRFKCLNSTEGMYCLQSTGTGFAITKDGFREIRADERAPRSMRGPAPDEDPRDPTSTRPSR